MTATKESVDEMLGLRFPISFYDQAIRSRRNTSTLSQSPSCGDVFGPESQYGPTRIRQVQVDSVTVALRACWLIEKGQDHWALDVKKATKPLVPASSKSKKKPDEREVVLHESARDNPGKRQFGRLLLPCGFGKSGMISTLAALRGGNVLIVTNDQGNAMQMLGDLLQNTKIAETTQVMLAVTSTDEVRAAVASHPDAKDHLFQSHVYRQKFPSSAKEKRSRTLFEPGSVSGVLVVKRNLLWDLSKASSQTSDVAQRIFSTFWNTLLVDECDTVATSLSREAFDEGRCYDWPASDDACSLTYTQFMLNFNVAILTSATLTKHERVGNEWLNGIGPLLMERHGIDGESTKTVAYTEIHVLRCDDGGYADEGAPWYRMLEPLVRSSYRNSFMQLSRCSPEKASMTEMLIHAHMVRGSKVIVFTKNIAHANAIAALFPKTAILCTGEDSSGSKQLRESFLKQPQGIWITTCVLERGFDCPDVDVVINCVNEGESSSKVPQRMGRAQRMHHQKEKAYFYDLVSPVFGNEVGGETDLSKILKASRYRELHSHHYADRMRAHTTADFMAELYDDTKQATSHVKTPTGAPLCPPDADVAKTLFQHFDTGVSAIVSDPVVELAFVLSILDHADAETSTSLGKRRREEPRNPTAEEKKKAPPPPKDAAQLAIEQAAKREAKHKSTTSRVNSLIQRGRERQQMGFVQPPKRAPALPAAAPEAPAVATQRLKWFDELDDTQRHILEQQFARCLPNRKSISLDDYAVLAAEVANEAKAKIALHDEWRTLVKSSVAKAVARPAASSSSTP